MEMDLKTEIEVLPCGKCEDMIGCDNCIFVKEAKELYKQIRADAIEDCISIVDGYLVDMPITHNNIINALCKLKEQK